MQLKRNDKWTYSEVTNCYIEFTSVNKYQLPKTFRLDKILRQDCALPKLNLKLSEIEKDAKDKNIIPKNLVLVDNDNKVIETIDFNKDTHVAIKRMVCPVA